MRRLLVILILFVTLGALALVWLRSRGSAAASPASSAASASVASDAPVIEKQPAVVATRRFNPAAPPPDMPPLHPGEQAQCDSNFISSAIVGGQTQRTGINSAVVTVTHVKMGLQLNITIWVPEDVTVNVLEHEEGHRQISEAYYATANQVAARVASSYLGKKIEITGSDLTSEANRVLQDMGSEITAEFGRQLDPDAAQLRYDAITDHARNDVPVKDAMAAVLKLTSQ